MSQMGKPVVIRMPAELQEAIKATALEFVATLARRGYLIERDWDSL